MLKKMRVVLKRAQYFITCNGSMLGTKLIDYDYIASRLIDEDREEVYAITDSGTCARQMNLFTDFNLATG